MNKNQELNNKSTGVNSGSDVLYYVGMGASAGGLQAIESFIMNMPERSGMAFIIVQHLSPDYKSLMVELLSKKTKMQVLRAEDGMVVKADHVYLIPPKKDLTIFHGKLILRDQDRGMGMNLPIDIFFRSLAEDQGDRSVAIVLSGTGSDGTRGVRSIKEHNGLVMVQDEESAKFNGMPLAAISTGLADFILAPEDMPKHLLAYVKHPSEARRQETKNRSDDDSLTKIFAELREKTKVDFTFYKPSTIMRRIERRMAVCQVADLDEYVQYIYDSPGEVNTLYRELLIGVTSFFRDPSAMDKLLEIYLPKIMQESGNREIRLWVAGCSTGEEAYTIAILAKEAMEKLGISRDIKIFATDIDRDAIISAGNGVYAESITADVSPRLLSKYFYRRGEHYQIARIIREMIVFAQHNLVKDPPFTNIDLVSCRNLLIYLQPVLQQKALQMFNFSLRSNGILFLGTSETVGEMMDFFSPLDPKYKFYDAKGREHFDRAPLAEVSEKHHRKMISDSPARNISHAPGSHINRDDHDVLIRFLDVISYHYIYSAVIVNEQNEVVYTLGNTEGLFKIPSGRIVFDIAQMALKDISIPLTTGIQKVFRSLEPLTYSNIKVRFMGQNNNITMKIAPLAGRKGKENLVAVFFELTKQDIPDAEENTEEFYDINEQVQQRIKDLESDLQFTRENLQATIEELETSNEELQATNEELLASNEELQSTNEELQSTNEELYTVNSEYQNKINELTELNNDVDNLLSHSQIGKLLLDEDLNIRRFSPEIAGIFRVVDNDIGRPITHLAHTIKNIDPVDEIRKVQESNEINEVEVSTSDNDIYLMRVIPYNIAPDTFAGFLLTFVNITSVKKTEQELQQNVNKIQDVINYMPVGLFIYKYDEDEKLYLVDCNPKAEEVTGKKLSDWKDKEFDEIWPKAENIGLSDKFIQVVKEQKAISLDNTDYRDGEVSGIYRIRAYPLPNRHLAVNFEDISRTQILEDKLYESEDQNRFMFETMTEGIVFQSADGEIIDANPSAEKILGLSLDQMKGLTSMNPRWKALREDGSELPGDEHPAMVALSTGKTVSGFIMGVDTPDQSEKKWLLVNAVPRFRDGEDKAYQVYATFNDISDRINSERSDKVNN